MTLAGLAALGGSAALGFWGGFEASLYVSGSLLYQATVSEAEHRRVDLSRLDAGQLDLLRESLNLELESSVRFLCAGPPKQPIRDQATTVLRRVAVQWQARPPTIPDWHSQNQVIQEGFREVQTCLARAMAEGAAAPRQVPPPP
jgi:hypothetical protein